MTRFGKTHTGPWYADEKSRIVFERQVQKYFPEVRRGTAKVDGETLLAYRTRVEVPFYESRKVEILFYPRHTPGTPIVLTDGPIESPHRYPSFERRRLCLWYPHDPPEARWIWDDGLLHLLGLTRLHLFREAWWRESGEWLGPQAPHSLSEKPELPAH